MRSIHLVFLLGLTILAACGSNNRNVEEDHVDPERSETAIVLEQQKVIQGLEDSLYDGNMKFKRRTASQVFDVYLAYAAEHPLDSLAPEYIFRAAQVSTGLDKNERAIKLYDRIIRNYPGWVKIPETRFMKGFTYDNHMDQKGAAKQAYEELIYEHPDHELAAQAKQLIDNMQFSDEELIKKWKEENS